MNQPKNPTKYLIFSLVLIVIDQISKVLVHKYMEPGYSGQIVLLGNWLKLHYVLNPGMAFGMQLGHEYGKLFLTLFRLVAMCAIGWYLVYLARAGAAQSLLWALAMILGGAVGNVIDSTFYGVIFDNAPYDSATPWFHGQVIDMIFVDPWEGLVPEWVPVWGGQFYSTPIFNIADSCIFIGVCTILIFQANFHPEKPETTPEPADRPEVAEEENNAIAEVESESASADVSGTTTEQDLVVIPGNTDGDPEVAYVTAPPAETDPIPVENTDIEPVSEVRPETTEEHKEPEQPLSTDKKEEQQG